MTLYFVNRLHFIVWLIFIVLISTFVIWLTLNIETIFLDKSAQVIK